jgi:archaeosine-15-forming tRNA-guanine transglycosylase
LPNLVTLVENIGIYQYCRSAVSRLLDWAKKARQETKSKPKAAYKEKKLVIDARFFASQAAAGIRVEAATSLKMFRLTCNNFEKNLVDSLRSFRQNDEFTDVTITCDVKSDAPGVTGFKKFPQFKAHRVVLVSSTSDFLVALAL